MHGRRTFTVACLLVAGLAGCLDDDTTEPVLPDTIVEPEWALQALFAGQDPDDTDRIVAHDHADLARHQGLSTPNFEIIGWDPLVSEYHGATPGQHFCGDVSDAGVGDRRLAVATSHTTDVAMVVMDVTDPEQPVFIGELVLPYVFVYDAAIFDDGRYAALVGNPDETVDDRSLLAGSAAAAMGRASDDTIPFTPFWRDACGNERPVGSTEDTMQYGYSTILVDLEDPANPFVLDFVPHKARNMHSVSTATVDGVRFVATSGLEAVPCDPTGTISCSAYPRFGNLLSYFEYFTVEDTAIGTRLLPYSHYSGANVGDLDLELAQLGNGHVDATIQKHPVTGQTIAYMAHWDGGFLIASLDGPGQITPLATWGAVSADDPDSGNIHSAVPLDEMWGDRHLTLTGQEVCCQMATRPGGAITMLDTTDPSNPVEVAMWTIPVQGKHGGYLFSTHYPIMDGTTMYVSLYHGGVWAVDASEEHWPHLPSTGVFLPDRAPPEGTFKASPAPEVLEAVVLGEGQLLVLDANSGAYAVEFTGPHPDVAFAAGWGSPLWQ